MFMASLKYDILDWLNVSGRIRMDNANTESETRYHASGQGILYANTHGNGMFGPFPISFSTNIYGLHLRYKQNIW